MVTLPAKPGLRVGSIDDWSGISDPKLRRKLQNRLNQKKYRARKPLFIPRELLTSL